MENRITIKRFEIGQQIEGVQVDAQGNKWLLYSLVGEDKTFWYMKDGSQYVRVLDPKEWQDTYACAIVLTGNPADATDLTCERIKWLMQSRGEWSPMA